ncbi:copper resistance protein CopC [Halobacillus litoralis]|uniref:copper resistance CopC family protein n=1 Tax=Halobacillus litoralis TaxID=45668 RepID=UPI001CD195F0|nr:copper resistance CopC family protein [Halobacillus litoralis]MCA0972237.1 copper resistance protein CopC [Halobacillus litoralis]
MKKMITAWMLVLTLLVPAHAFAHTGKEEADPSEGSVVTESINEVTVLFTTPISEGSTVTLTTADGAELPLQDVVVDGDTMIINTVEPLPNGTINVDWAIVGEDGHPIEDGYSFEVDAPVQEAPTSEEEGQAEAEEEPADMENTPESETESASETASDESSDDSNQLRNSLLIAGIAALLLLVGVVVLFMRKPNRNE